MLQLFYLTWRYIIGIKVIYKYMWGSKLWHYYAKLITNSVMRFPKNKADNRLVISKLTKYTPAVPLPLDHLPLEWAEIKLHPMCISTYCVSCYVKFHWNPLNGLGANVLTRYVWTDRVIPKYPQTNINWIFYT